ncbi:DUF1819 family protein [Jiella pelagia]|uniref:DUF1819 family protein n=1 Tax=Jiella pelagia TaxID=2986949 RepID=A0ABY7C6E7_9HYPH|nr:DUF1819 family protein [Jiella pelagia]WAP70920.1 DUF1819 family protein [Jiella pelagia]
MSFSTGGLFLAESVEFARLHQEGEPWSETQRRACLQGLSTLPKAASQQRTIREISTRIASLDAKQRMFLISEADRQEQQALVWLAACRAYQFLREFSVEVLRERYLSWRLHLGLESFNTFYASKAEWDEGLAGLSGSTRGKLRQVLFRMMREAGILSRDGEIQRVGLSNRLYSLIESGGRSDLLIFPGVDARNEVK